MHKLSQHHSIRMIDNGVMRISEPRRKLVAIPHQYTNGWGMREVEHGLGRIGVSIVDSALGDYIEIWRYNRDKDLK